MEKHPTARSRIREYADDKGIPYREIYARCNFADGTLSQGGDIGSEKIATFMQNYPDADLHYIIMGEKSAKNENSLMMTDVINNGSVHNEVTSCHEFISLLANKDAQLTKSQEQIDRLLGIIESINNK